MKTNKSKHRSFRLPGDYVDKLKGLAKEQGTTLTKQVEQAIALYLKQSASFSNQY